MRSERLDAGGGARAMLGLSAWGFVLAKAAALAFLLQDRAEAGAVGAFLVGFGGDVVVLACMAAAASGLARATAARPRTSRLVGGALVLAGLAVGLYAVFNVYFVACFGSPMTSRMLAYRMGLSDAWAMAGSTPAQVTLALLALFLLSAWPVGALAVRALAPAGRARAAAYGASIYLVVAILAQLSFPESHAAFGLSRNAVTTFVGSAVKTGFSPVDAEDGPRVDWDAPSTVPADPAYTAPIEMDEDAPRPRHVVVWLAESVGTRYLQLYGAPEPTTPNLVRLKDKSLRFDAYYANAPISIKSIFSSLCGMYPYPDVKFMTEVNPRIACTSLMEALDARGWDAALFHGGIFGFTDKLKFLGERGFDVMLDAENMPEREKYYRNGWGIDDRAMLDNGLKWLDGRADPTRPSLSVYIPLYPHYDYFLPPGVETPFPTRGDLDKYRNGLRFTDALFGRLYDEYERRGLADDTLFVFVGDHGEAFGQHPRNKLHGSFIYDENIHAPLVLINARLFPRETVSRRTGSHVDLLPTVLDLLGLPPPPTAQGQSLVSDEYRHRPVYFGAYHQDRMLGLRDGRWKLIRNQTTGIDELYDLERDPLEKVNLASSRPDLVEEYGARVRDWAAKQKALLETHPKLGEGYLHRLFAAAEVSIVSPDGASSPCAAPRPKGGLSCAGQPSWMYAAVEQMRSFNISRECIRVHPPEQGKLVVRFPAAAPPPKFVGVGLDDGKRFARGTPIHARWRIGALQPFELVVSDKFEENFRARAVEGLPDGAAVPIEVEVASADWRNRTVCLTLSP